MTALVAKLKVEIESRSKGGIKIKASLDTAVNMRFKELNEFNAKEKDLVQSIESLKAAVTVLGKHHGSLLQMPQGQLRNVVDVLRREMDEHAELLEGVLTHSQRRSVVNFAQEAEGTGKAAESDSDFFDQGNPAADHNPAASGEIFGILTTMLEQFQKDLADLQEGEASKIKAFGEMKASLKIQITQNEERIDTLNIELAAAMEKLSALKVDLLDTRARLKADEEYLKMLKEMCANIDKEWEIRQKMRAEEMEACSKALAVLSGDDAHDLFTRTFNPEFAQMGSSSRRQAQASGVLRAVAKRLGSPRLAAIAMHVRLDAFTKVKKAINDMIEELLQEKKDEIKKKDFCVEEFNTNELQTEKKKFEQKSLIAKIADLKATIEELAKDIEQLNADIAEMEVELKKAAEERAAQHKEFETTVADQRATQKLLKMALKVLKKFYGGGEGSMARVSASLLHRKEQSDVDDPTTVVVEVNVVPAGQPPAGPVGPPAPPGFKPYNKNEKSGGVMYMIENIIRDAKIAEEEATRDENESQAEYEKFVKETTLSIAECKKDIVNKSEEKAKAEEELTVSEEMLENVEVELEELDQYLQQLHKDCDFLIKNFDARQAARDQEIEALKTALSILSGAKFDAFLQNGRF